MPPNDISPPDALRTPNNALRPDPRMEAFVLIDGGDIRKTALADYHCAIADLELNGTVPISVRIHFETAKNLFLYAWFVYRFHPVAEQQALVSLEFALRERLLDLDLMGQAKVKKMGLSDLLKCARTNALIRNEAFRHRLQRATDLAKQRYSFEQLEEMTRSECAEAPFDDSHVMPTEEDLAFDWIGNLMECLPKIRNDYSHGSATLHPAVLRTFETVSDLINQLFPLEA